MTNTRRCLACGAPFSPLPHIPDQHFCSAVDCQRERRRRWQREQLHIDPDYRDNQARAQANWRAGHTDYWRQYRATHPDYRARNCALQRDRNVRRYAGEFANMDASHPTPPISSGVYVLRPVLETDVANMDTLIVSITVLSTPGGSAATIAKR